MSSSCSWGESLQFHALIPPDAWDALIYILGKKSTMLPVEGPSTATQHASAGSNSLLNSLMLVFQVEKSQKNILQRPRGNAASQERAEEFSDCYQNTQLCPPLTFGMWTSCDGQLTRKMNSHISSAGSWQLEKQVCLCVSLSESFPSSFLSQ